MTSCDRERGEGGGIVFAWCLRGVCLTYSVERTNFLSPSIRLEVHQHQVRDDQTGLRARELVGLLLLEQGIHAGLDHQRRLHLGH